VAALAVAALTAVAGGACTHATVHGLAPVAPDLFDSTGSIEPGPFAAAFNADGSRLAVMSGDGVGLVSHGRVRMLTPPGSHAVAFAWLGTDQLVVAEGPAITGSFEVFTAAGTDAGRVPLDPAFSVGSGYGMSASATTHSVLTVSEDPVALGGPERLRLVMVDLATGKATSLATTGVIAPAFIDATHALVTRPSTTHSLVEVVDVATGRVRAITSATDNATELGPVLDGAWFVYTTENDVWAVPAAGGKRRRLAHLPKHSIAVAVDPTGAEAVIVARFGDVSQLRALRLHQPPPLP
jgi:hypothetical protein